MRQLSEAPAPVSAGGNVTLGITNSGLIGIQGAYSAYVKTGNEGTNAVWILASAGFIFLM
jgi:hypothetical protein